MKKLNLPSSLVINSLIVDMYVSTDIKLLLFLCLTILSKISKSSYFESHLSKRLHITDDVHHGCVLNSKKKKNIYVSYSKFRYRIH